MLNKVYVLAIIFLLICIMVMNYTLTMKDSELIKSQVEIFKLNEKLKSIVNISSNTVKLVYKDKEVIKYLNVYIPPENPSISITTDTDDHVSVNYSRYGVGFFPFVGVELSDTVRPLLGARLGYFDRFGTGVSISNKAANLFLDTRLDFWGLKNSSFGLTYSTLKTLGLSWHIFL